MSDSEHGNIVRCNSANDRSTSSDQFNSLNLYNQNLWIWPELSAFLFMVFEVVEKLQCDSLDCYGRLIITRQTTLGEIPSSPESLVEVSSSI